ncbi:MAG: RIP metalloprotease RseP [Oligoflexia bacterium]|nr:RIP metalloprotease RseP [Oligoflexia bacterium]
MIFEKFAIFILFLGPLVFFHELGHFLFARFFGVRVETFSIGFGPKLFKFKKGDTEYALSLIPLGGYVKMFGDDPLNKDAIPEEQRKYSFTYKGKWARFWIVMGGPLANFIMAYFIFFGLLISGERIPELKIGNISQKSVFYEKGFLPGDVIKKVNDIEVTSPTDFSVSGDGLINDLTIGRDGQDIVLPVNMDGVTFLEKFMTYPPTLRKPVVVNDKGIKFVVSPSQDRVVMEDSLEEIYMDNLGKSLPVYLFKVTEQKKNKVNDIVYTYEKFPSQKFVLDLKNSTLDKELSNNGFKAIDLTIKSVSMKSAADEAGMKGGDTIVKINGTDVYKFEDLRKTIVEYDKDSVDLVIWRDGKEIPLTLTPKLTKLNGKKVKLIGVESAVDFIKIRFVETKSKGFIHSVSMAGFRTWDSIEKTFDGFAKLFTGQVGLNTIGGPLSIGKVASDSFNTSLSYFFQLMALISINLGLINLFPIPVLDGGHIMFIFLEIINRGPVSRRKMEIAQQVGLSLLLMLMVGAIFNDVTRLLF